MDMLAAENYVEAIACYSKQIAQKVETTRYDNATRISRTMGYKDGTANQAVDAATEIYTIEVVVNGERFVLGHPERWLKVLAHTHKMYLERFGPQWALTAKLRYIRGWEPTKVYVYQGISRRSFGYRRTEFIKMLLLYAVQNKLLTVE